MYLNELRIDDFGCFRNARIEAMDDNLVVLGGPQRAGKTTFLKVLRQFPDGIDRGGNLPPATDEYRVDAELTHDENRYRYVLNGHSRPSVSPIDGGPEVSADDIFGPITERQYRNLYTISLDELRRLPPGIDDSEDLARVLLGGAYGDIAEIPEIETSFSDRANDIGLTKGNPNTKTSQLNDPYQKIRNGVETQKKANQQVDEYNTVTQTLEETRSEESDVEAEISHRQHVRDRLNILQELFDPLQQLETLNARIEDADPETIEAFPTHLADRLEHFEEQFETATANLTEARQRFDQQATNGTGDKYYEWLLENETQIESLAANQTLWERTIEDLTEQQTELETKRTEIERDIAALYSDWDGSFADLDEIETSTVDTARVADIASSVTDLQSERNELKASIESNRTRKEQLESKVADMEAESGETKEITVSKREPALVAAVALVVGTGVSVVASPLVGGFVGLVILGIGLYMVDSTVEVESTVDADPYREVKGQITTLESDITADTERQTKLDEQIAAKQEEFSTLVTELGLPDELPAKDVPDFYEQVVELDERIATYRDEQDGWETDKDEFATEIEDVTTLLEDVVELQWTAADPLEDVGAVVETFEMIVTDLELARRVHQAERVRADCIDDIDSVLADWDDTISLETTTGDEQILQYTQAFADEAERISELEDALEKCDRLETQITTRLESASAKSAFEPLRDDDEPWISVARSAAQTYTDTDAIEDEIREENARIEDLDGRREELRETCIELEQKQDDLASEDDLQEAQAQIDQGRVEFERLGEAYAVNRIAESMVTQLHERLMADVVHSLVDDASTIFSKITQEYEGIELDGDVQDLEFHALRDTKPAHGVGELSRATAEQLFLAVRLARIRQTDVSLPVVLDDAATNFDPNHMSRIFDVIDELTATNQVFFLTCHPQCVRITASNGCTAQYWSLSSGQFTRSDSPETLEEHLSAD